MAAVVGLSVVVAGCSDSTSTTKTRPGSPRQSSRHTTTTTAPRSTPQPASTASASPTGTSHPPITDVSGVHGPASTRVSVSSLRKAWPHITFAVHMLTFQGRRRAYLVAAPRSAGRSSRPMTVVLGGWRASAAFEAERTGFLPSVSAGRSVTVYPVSYDESWKVPGVACCHDAGTTSLDDAGFVAAATRDALAHLPVDRTRTYLVGYSNGGKLALALTCSDADLWAAVATMGAVPQQPCSARTPISVMLAMGSADPDQPTDHAHQPPVPLMNSAAAVFRRRDSCPAGSTTADPPNAEITDSSTCAAGTAVRTVAYAGLGHRWPGEGTFHGEVQVSPEISLPALIAQFFVRHRRSTARS